MSTLGSNFNYCTALGKSFRVGPPATLIKECLPLEDRLHYSSSAHTFVLSKIYFIINTFHLDPYASQLNVAYRATSCTYISEHSPDLVKNKSEV